MPTDLADARVGELCGALTIAFRHAHRRDRTAKEFTELVRARARITTEKLP
jgi:hypothetical protein